MEIDKFGSTREESTFAEADENMNNIPTDDKRESSTASAPGRAESKYKFNHAEYERWSKTIRKPSPPENEA
jgi:hypothetical protein